MISSTSARFHIRHTSDTYVFDLCVRSIHTPIRRSSLIIMFKFVLPFSRRSMFFMVVIIIVLHFLASIRFHSIIHTCIRLHQALYISSSLLCSSHSFTLLLGRWESRGLGFLVMNRLLSQWLLSVFEDPLFNQQRILVL